MQIKRHFMKHLMLKDKEGIGLDYFNYNFYKNLKQKKIDYTEGQFDEFLFLLFNLDSKNYKEWYKVLSQIPYSFIKKYTSLITSLINANNMEDVKIAYEMIRYSDSLVNGIVPTIDSVAIRKDKKEYLLRIEKQLLLMESELEDNILRKNQEKFYDKYNKCDGNPYLSDLYNEILDTFEERMRKALNDQVNRVQVVCESNAHQLFEEHSIDNITVFMKKQHKAYNRKH